MDQTTAMVIIICVCIISVAFVLCFALYLSYVTMGDDSGTQGYFPKDTYAGYTNIPTNTWTHQTTRFYPSREDIEKGKTAVIPNGKKDSKS